MTATPSTTNALASQEIPDPLGELRTARVRQIALFVLLASLAVIPLYWSDHFWQAVVPLACASALMAVCLFINGRGRTDLASIILVISIFGVSAALQWYDQGLRDASILCFPAVLILGGLLINRRSFIVLLLTMVVFMTVMTVATDPFHLRTDPPNDDPLVHLRDAVIVLVGTGWAVWIIVSDLREAMAKLRQQVGMYQDAQSNLLHISRHDALTGLPNRNFERQHMEQCLAYAKRHRTQLAFLFIDLDNFKTINDSLGHAAGDEFLRQVAARLRAAVRDSDIVSRHGGDEFVVGLTDIAGLERVTAIAQNILSSLAAPYALDTTQFVTSGSVGIAIFPTDGNDYETLLQHADIAMYQAKESGRNALRFFDATMNDHVEDGLQVLTALRQAIGLGEFALAYQPIVDLHSQRLCGCEALIRWEHPERGLLLPLEFIATAEKSGLIVQIGEWVLHEACRQLVAWRASGAPDLVMSVNLSTVQFRRGDIDQIVASALRTSGLPASCLELEITETTLIQDNEAFTQSLQRLKALGVKIAIDDFGTGYSSLSYLQRFAVDKLKIDRAFIRRVRHEPQQRAIVQAVIQMAQSMHLATTAEGIEDQETGQLLQEMGCVLGQGYYYDRPLAPSQFLHRALASMA